MSDRIHAPGTRRPGDPLTAADRNARNAAVARLGRLSGVAGLVAREGVSGRSLALSTPETAHVKLTTSADANGAYAAKEVLAGPGGTWLDSGRTMPRPGDPCYERNHNVSLTAGDRVYLARRAATTGEWIFAHRAPGGTGGGPLTGLLLGCLCRTPPATLYLHVTNPVTGVLVDSTIVYGPTPTALLSLALGTNSYLSDTPITDPSGEDFRYYVGCFASIIRISRAYESSVMAGGGPFLDSVLYFWTAGFPGNTCTPFSLTSGTIFSGGPGTTTATLNGTP